MRLQIALALALAIISLQAHSLELKGYVRVIDGDTVELNGETIRLAGIDAPEINQKCKNIRGKNYPCGAQVADKLKLITTGQEVVCQSEKRGFYGRLLGICYLSDVNLNQKFVREGDAVAFLKYSNMFKVEEQSAREAKRGIWAGTFIRPAEFRADKFTAAKVEASLDSPDPNCLIKGNINSKAVKIYHTPWASRHYKRTKINTSKGERWFCDEAEAVAAGWRQPYR